MKYFHTLQVALQTIQKRTSTSLFGLKQFKQCIEDLGSPQLKLRCVHVAGTNGKGSTSNYVASIAQRSGYTVGLYTSPFLLHHNDRFRVNGVDMSDSDLLRYINMTTHLWDKYELTMFEIDTLIAIWYFLDKQVDLAIFEVGLGGRLDATNVIMPLVSVITTIGFDHMDLLGDTLDLIAFEKAGIIKSGVPIITYQQGPLVDSVFERVANERQSPLVITSIATQMSANLHSQVIKKDDVFYTLAMNAGYQCINASLAIECAHYLQKYYPKISNTHIHEGLRETLWFGRFQKVSDHPLIIIDGAHNINGIEALVQSIKICPKPIHVLFSAIQGKDHTGMLTVLQPHVQSITVCEFDFYRKQKAQILAINPSIRIIEDPHLAYASLLHDVKDGTGIICGSLYFLSYMLLHVINKDRSKE